MKLIENLNEYSAEVSNVVQDNHLPEAILLGAAAAAASTEDRSVL